MKHKLSLILNIITVPPLVGLLTLTWLFLVMPEFHATPNWYLASVGILVLLPVSAYWLKNLIPSIKAQGRDGERKLAFIMAVISYVVGTPLAFFGGAPRVVLFTFFSYLSSGLLLAFINKIVKFKASGHACGVTGPLTLLVFIVGRRAWLACFLVPAVFWTRLVSKRHTWRELIGGALVGMVGTCLCMVLF